MNLSKSRYTSGIRCEKLLWLNQYHPELAEDMGNESVLENGNEVGDLARGLFGKSILIDFNKVFESMINDTKENIKQKPNVICEASFNYDGNISVIQMLKAVQGTIAAVKAKNNKNNGKLPSNKSNGINIYDDNFDENKIKKYLEDTLDENLLDNFIELIDDCYDWDSTIKWLTDRLLDIKANNYPESFAQKRENMPQVYKGGTDQNDKNTAMPDKKGSALNKLKDDKFIKSAIK